MSLRLGVSIGLLLIALRAAAEVAASPPMSAPAREHYDRALAEYAAKRYESAITEFQASFEIDPRNESLFGWAQAERLSGDCASAVLLYRRYLILAPSARATEAARQHLAACEEALATRPEATAGETPTSTMPVPPGDPPAPAAGSVVTAPVSVIPPRPWYRDPAGGALVGVGLGALVAGTGLAVSGAVDASANGSSYDSFAHQFAGAQQRWIAGWVVLGAGTLLVVSGSIRYGLRARAARFTGKR